ncbi:hypothetical protein FHS43_004808 [Streptosporangium becharense]|uniref:Uncharacterized protein n=1 Tax=Streptosporangium becharense TaxID=1816182 RepID=A0A7W9II54_9ACTN|nr:hypothetical protein [Streptosporangium becharense]MBB2913504.1 hypothetical protein [Streptosporangium becharense]MBB5821194.1 hypothetical protein [Streptosporangium becharense]
MTALIVLEPGDQGEPGWVEAHSLAEVEELVRAGHTVVVTPATLAAAALSAAGAHGTTPAGARKTDPAGAGGAGSAGAGEIDPAGVDEAAELTAASVCAWAGARVFRTARPDQVRLAVEMADSLAGRRPPALTRRGLA